MKSEELSCLCGCGMTVGQPMELVNGEWVIAHLSDERLRQLAQAPHPSTHSHSEISGTVPLSCGKGSESPSDFLPTAMAARPKAVCNPYRFLPTIFLP